MFKLKLIDCDGRVWFAGPTPFGPDYTFASMEEAEAARARWGRGEIVPA